MWSKICAGLLASAAVVAASAPAMSAPQARACRVVDAEKLPSQSGGAAAICSAIEQAVAARAPKAHYSAEVRVLSMSRLAVNVDVSGRKLAEQHYAVMDRNLNAGSIKRFAEAIADEIAKAARQG